MSKLPQLGLILKSKQSSLKWAQVEIICSIHLGARVFQSWCNFQKNGKDTYYFESRHLFNIMSKWTQLGLIIKNRQSSLNRKISLGHLLNSLFSEKWLRPLQLKELASLKQTELKTSTWAHFKLQTVLLNISSNWGHMLNSFRSNCLSMFMLFSENAKLRAGGRQQ